jgi:hypothetical protein
MKKVIFTLLTLCALQLSAQEFAPVDLSIMDLAYFPNGAHRAAFAKNAEEKAKLMPRIKIIYSRPLVKGRTIFGDLVKYDQPWRFGANESTEVTFYTPVKIGESVLAPGRYTLYCVPGASSWTLKVHPNLDGWGNFGYDDSKALAEVSGTPKKSDSLIEAFSITMYEASPRIVHLKAGWENTVVEFPIELL